MSLLNSEEKQKWGENISIILRQTNYTEDEAIKKLIEYNGNYMLVIKDYMGIKDKKEQPIKSINQEIYKQLRLQLNTSIEDYNKKMQSQLEDELKK